MPPCWALQPLPGRRDKPAHGLIYCPYAKIFVTWFGKFRSKRYINLKSLIIKHIKLSSDLPDLAEVSARLDKLPGREEIGTVNWSDFDYRPRVSFITAYSSRELFIKYYVREQFVRAVCDSDNQMVCNDSCVEFFVLQPGTSQYYNFEFNSIGTCYLGKGTGREDSVPLEPATVSGVRRLASLGSEPFDEKSGDQEWELTVAIPLDTLFGQGYGDLSGTRIKGNFYKCGDALSEPHYLTWSEVKTENPDYHRPEFFGELVFD